MVYRKGGKRRKARTLKIKKPLKVIKVKGNCHCKQCMAVLKGK